MKELNQIINEVINQSDELLKQIEETLERERFKETLEREKFEERHSNKVNKFMLIDFILLAGIAIMSYGVLLGNALITVQ